MSKNSFDPCTGRYKRKNGSVWIQGYHGQQFLSSNDIIVKKIAEIFYYSNLNLSECCAPMIYYSTIDDMFSEFNLVTKSPSTNMGFFITHRSISCH